MVHRSNRRGRGRAIVAASFILSVLSVSSAFAQAGGGNGGGGGGGGGAGGGGGSGGAGEIFSNNLTAAPNPNFTPNKDYFFSFNDPLREPCRKLKRNDRCR